MAGLFGNGEFGYYKAIQFDTNINSDCITGRVGWDVESGTLKVGMIGDDVCLNLGQEMFIYVKNISGATILNGTPVYVSNDGNSINANIEIDMADADIQDTCRKTLAMATEDILNNDFGYVTTFGLVRDINTAGYDEGAEVYVKQGGGYTNIKPALPASVTKLGFCVRVHAVEGIIFINVQQKSLKELMVDSGDLTIRSQTLKTVVLEQPVWDDIIIPITRTRIPVANFPTWALFMTPISAYTFIVNDYVEFSFEIPHKYKEGTNLDCHIHGATNGLGVTDKYIKFRLDYTISNDSYNVVTGIGSVFTTSAFIEFEYKIPANTTDRSGFYFDIGDILGTNIKIGSQIHCKLTRIASTGLAPIAPPFISTFGIHYKNDTIGSRQEYVK